MNQVKKGFSTPGVVAALMLGCLSVSAHAETVTQKLFESTTLITGGVRMDLTELDLATPGTLLIELKDLQWPTMLDTLSFSLTDANHILQTFTASKTVAKNTWTFDVNAAGTFYGSIFAKPSTTSKAGMYYANISYQSVAPVPLPAAAWFLISGIAGLAALKPKQKLSTI
jgi:hypothetical protein